MKHKHTHYTYASFALLLFVALGYMVKFYPEALTGFDSNIQTWVRGDLPAGLTRFFKTITILGNTPVQAIIAIVADRKSTRLNSSHSRASRMPSSA